MEHRKHARLSSIHLSTYKHFADDKTVDSQGNVVRTLDLGKGGALLELRERFEPNSILELDMMLGESRIRCLARITNVREGDGVFMTGVAFTDMKEEDQEILKSYLTWEYFA
jgi:hypothetical protein